MENFGLLTKFLAPFRVPQSRRVTLVSYRSSKGDSVNLSLLVLLKILSPIFGGKLFKLRH